jgi:hypothetical protein
MRTTVELALELERVIAMLEASNPKSRRLQKLKSQLALLISSIE